MEGYRGGSPKYDNGQSEAQAVHMTSLADCRKGIAWQMDDLHLANFKKADLPSGNLT